MRRIWAFLALAYALSWLALIPLIHFGANEEVLILGICGPAFAAMLLSRSGQTKPDWQRRLVWFAVMTMLGWVVLIFTSEWRGVEPHWPVQVAILARVVRVSTWGWPSTRSWSGSNSWPS